MAEYQLGIIGAGNMAEALLKGVIAGQIVAADDIVVSDPLQQRRELFAGEYGVTVVEDNSIPAACPRVLLAVKPQVMGELLDSIAPVVQANALIISIAAGVSTSLMDEKLGGNGRLVRVMPNTPMLVGEGVSAVAAGARATDADIQWTCELLSPSGKTVVVDQSQMDAVTAVSGSGPAYFFYLIEAMVAAGQAEGLDRQTAVMLAGQTCIGAGKLLQQSSVSPEELRGRVTSPGGTTQRAIETMDAAGVKDSLIKAVRAAADRSRELGE